MNLEHMTVITCSGIKFTEILKYYGKADVVQLSFLNLLYKLIDNPNMTIPFDCDRQLKEMAAKIQMSNPTICTVPINVISASNIIIANVAPTVSDGEINYDISSYTFKYANFTTDFADADGDIPETVRIVSLPINGEITYVGSPISAGFEFDISSVSLLEYTHDTGETIDTFNFRVSDNNINKLFSNMALFTINIDEIINQCPDSVGVNAFTLDSKSTKIFSLADFTSGTTPPYSDPDGDPAEAVKFTTIPGIGELQLNGVDLVPNDVVLVGDITLGLLTYVSDPTDETLYVATFDFSVSDTGAHCFTAGGVMVMTVSAYVNQPAVIGDGELTVEEGVIITFTRDDFTLNTTPPYTDPEGDIADKLKVTVLPSSGILKLNGIAVIANDVINFTDIDATLLTYEQAVAAGGTLEAFTFQIADAGSGIFVS